MERIGNVEPAGIQWSATTLVRAVMLSARLGACEPAAFSKLLVLKVGYEIKKAYDQPAVKLSFRVS